MHTLAENVEAVHIKQMLPGIKDVVSLERHEMDWIGSFRTFPKFNKQSFALQIFVAASKYNPLITRFAVQIIDNDRAPATPASGISWHMFDATTGTWSGPEHMPPHWTWEYLNLY